MVVSQHLMAKKGSLEHKGYYNAAISAHIFRLLEREGIPTHFECMLSDTMMLVDAVDIIPVEVIVRNIAAGSITEVSDKRGNTSCAACDCA